MGIPYRVSGEIDIVRLFLHDQADCDCLSEDFVAHELGLMLNEATGHRYSINVIPPEYTGLDRFVVKVGENQYSGKCHSAAELQEMLPGFVFDAIRSIQKIGK